MAPNARGSLTLVGLGRDPAADVTLDALDALARCETAVCAALPPKALALVRRHAPAVRAFPTAATAARALRAELAAGRRVAWVGMGHPAECAPPAAARAGAATRVAKGVNRLEEKLVETRQILSYGEPYLTSESLEPAKPRKGDCLIGTAEWPDDASSRARRGRELLAEAERLLGAGRAEDAAKAAHDAAILLPEDPRPWEALGRIRLALKDPAEAWRMFWEARLLGLDEARAKAGIDAALTGLGRAAETSAARAAARPSPGAGKALREKATALAAAGRLEDARAAWDAAVAAEPSAGAFDERAAFLKLAGLPFEDLADRREALDLESTPERLAAYAESLRKARFHALARETLDRAAKAPGAGGEVFRLRGLSRLRVGDWRGALRDGEEAARRGVPGKSLLFLRAEAAAASGDAPKVLAAHRAAATPEDAAFLEGYAALAAGRPDPAAFERAAALQRDPESARARLSRVLAGLARAWGLVPVPRKKAGLVLIGLGIAPPRSLTARAVAALRGCDLVFQNSSSDMVGPMLRLMCRDIRPSPFHHQYDVARLVEAMLAEAERGKTVGFATFGHPLLFGPLARAAYARFDRAGVPVTAVAGPSTAGEMLSAGASLGPVGRWQVLCGLARGSADAAARLDVKAATLLYPEEGPGGGAAPLLSAVRDRFPAGHPALVLGPDAEDWDRLTTTTLEEVARMPAASAKQRLVFVPPARRAA